MPRVARIKSKSKIYHIMIRGINQQNIFIDDEDYEKFIAILAKYHKKSEYEIYAYYLMGNQVLKYNIFDPSLFFSPEYRDTSHFLSREGMPGQ